MKIRCPLCSHVCQASRSGIMLPSTLTSPPRTKTSRPSAPTSRPNLITFRTLMFVIPREFSFLIRREGVKRNKRALVPTSRNYLHFRWNYGSHREATSVRSHIVYVSLLFRGMAPDFPKHVFIDMNTALFGKEREREREKEGVTWSNFCVCVIWRDARRYPHDFLTQRAFTPLWRAYDRAVTPVLFYRGG